MFKHARPFIAGALALLAAAACRPAAEPSYLFMWAGDSARTSSDFLAVINATPGSPAYGRVVASVATGEARTHPHHTEAVMPASGHLLANGFHAGKTWLFDLNDPLQPRVLTSFGSVGGYSHPHTFVRLANGNVLTTFQYRADSNAAHPAHVVHDGTVAPSLPAVQTTGGLVEMDERGQLVRAGSARDTTIRDARLYPYSALPLPAVDRIVSTTTNMDDADTVATGRWIQLWRLSDLTLLRSLALEPGPRGNENRWTGEPFLLSDGSVYIHTFACGLYRVSDLGSATPRAALVHTFEGMFCGVPIVTGHFYLATVPQAHALVALDISDPEHPRQVSSLSFGTGEEPHWIAIDPTRRRVVLNSSDRREGQRLYLVNLDPATGSLTMDQQFRDAGDSLPGIKLSGRTWPHGFTGHAAPHGTVFSR